MTDQSTAPLRSRLAEQAASDLAENRRRQQELADRLAVLQQEEALLTDILSLAQRYEGFADPSRLLEQLQDEPVVTRARRAGTATRRSGATRTAAAGAPAKAGAKRTSPRPLLGELLLELLRTHDGPRLAKELRDELLERHPDRNPTPQVVRNTLESLVAKGRIQRHKQQRSVRYTVVEPDAAG
ncbi:hypothetical protein [Streptomyces chromofuscus]|uniref:Regulatory protein n=1 Tax=Streptomyces chromofuscus TaxID=42881 RepID=A0A7M2T6H0_STRCW|nr:hypothetical protein [Streptomyces chromofuscus]QOV44256.1 hypothetical protein IPT68_32245 [Streptomyces chromofuscus]GGT31433.1 hypothetical protein GCM10010254_59900 [Streptomyces chromofuscus]